jgi:hypothetical protein
MKITEKIYDVQTGEETITERDETPSEKKSREIREKEIAAAQAEAEARDIARAELLAKLGITVDEAALLLG